LAATAIDEARQTLKPLIIGFSVILLCAGCGNATRSTRTDPPTAKNAVPHVLSESDRLPILVRKPIAPKTEADAFENESGGFRFPKAHSQPILKDEPFETDQEAVAAALTWLVNHFGDLPSGITLETKSILQSSSGRPAPEFEWDRGHTISFREIYNGIPTDSFALVYITGRSTFQATVELCMYEPVPGSAKMIVSKQAAVSAWRKVYEEKGADSNLLAQYDRRATPRLVYVWSTIANTAKKDEDDRELVSPTWTLDDEGIIMVDGHTGKTWVND